MADDDGAVTDKLDRYRSMRDFARTAEPSGAPVDGGTAPAADGHPRYVVQRHRARALHYDFRLEVDGVLASWAVPKGPSLDPKVRSLAIHVEDHPIEYFDFEGVIGSGEYGAGDVIVWDWGTWQPAKGADPARAIADGELHFDLDGEKLHGRFVLVRDDRRSKGARGGKEQWLMLHKADDFAQPGWRPDDHPRSVKSGRTNDEVKAAPASAWHGDRPASEAEEPLRVEIAELDGPTDDELTALDDLPAKGGVWSVGGQDVKVSNLDKVLFPGRDGGDDVTKRAFLRAAVRLAPWVHPYLAGRPVNGHRYPDGIDGDSFWQKAVPRGAPEWIGRWHNDEADRGETQWYVVPDSLATYAYLANLANLELHPWTSRLPHVHQPTWALIDIDPGTATSLDDTLVLARLYRTALEHLGVQGRPKVSGQRGIQIWIPIRPGYSFDQTRAWVETVSRAVGATVPDVVSWEWQTDKRGGRARLDFTQNAINKTLVAPFSTRPRPGATVSVTLEWDELNDPDLRPDRWTISSIFERLDERGDPLRDLAGLPQALPDL